MDVVHLASEVTPFAKTGGLADVASALPRALAAQGDRVFVLCPLYPSVWQAAGRLGVDLVDTGVRVGWDDNRVLETTWQGVRWVFLDYPGVFDRPGLYDDGQGQPYGDNPWRYAWFVRAALQAAPKLLWRAPDIVHAHDWQAALAPLVVQRELGWPGTRTVLTVHNLAYQGRTGLWQADSLGVPADLLHPDAFEHHGDLSFLKGGLALADAVTTVSPTYAREITTPQGGCGLDGLLRHRVRRLVGIRNGLDQGAWDPSADGAIPATYTAEDLGPKDHCKAALLREFDLTCPDGEPLVCAIGRLADQKGFDLVAELVPRLADLRARLILLGSGDPTLQDRFRWLEGAFRDHFRAFIGFDGALARRLLAGSDLTLVPSRFEPCGLVQLQAMRYGSVPVVRATGGLADTVHDPGDTALMAGEGTGFRFEHPTVEGLAWALGRAAGLYRLDPAGWHRLRQAAMRRDWGWAGPAQGYRALYLTLRGASQAASP